ncbi:MAG: hypothetical protein ACREJC_21640 [Tepidisphaeraceae bacterium]
MPPVNQGSRAALVTWTVVTSFLFVTATIFGIYFYVEAARSQDSLTTLTTKYREVVPDAALGGTDLAELREAKGVPENNINPSASLLDVAMARGRNLAALIAGEAASNVEQAQAAGKNALEQSVAKSKSVGLNVQANNLVGAVGQLSDGVVQRSNEAAAARKQADEATVALKQKIEETTAQIDAMNKTIEGIRAEQAAALASVQTVSGTRDDQVRQIQSQFDSQLRDSQETINKLNVRIADLIRENQRVQADFEKVKTRLNDIRPDVNRAELGQADGHIARLPGQGVCFIDLGAGDQILPGMTFEVYDRHEGVPALGDPNNDQNLPKGKASIEVTRVGPTSSEARIVRLTPGTAITEGDLIANLVYDRNAKYRFMVYGSFDLDRDGRATAQDADVVKRLVTQWGGEVTSNVNVDTDFVVLGKEPVIPTLTREERDDPIARAKYDAAVAESEAYQNIRVKASEYHIPILNQNRFLYMIGYYELSKR